MWLRYRRHGRSHVESAAGGPSRTREWESGSKPAASRSVIFWRASAPAVRYENVVRIGTGDAGIHLQAAPQRGRRYSEYVRAALGCPRNRAILKAPRNGRGLIILN